MNFATIFARIAQILPFAAQFVESIGTIAGPGKITSETKSTAVATAIHDAVGTGELVAKNVINDVPAFNAAIDHFVAGAASLIAALAPKK